MDSGMLTRRIKVAAGEELADLVIINGKIIDVFNGEIIKGDIAIVDGHFAGIGAYKGKEIIDAKGSYISPSFIEGHVHIESSMVSPPEFAKVLLLHGVTTIINDPHEIANVTGVKGIQYMLDSSEGLPVDILFMLPSCVPAAPFEHAGAVLTIKDLKPFFQHPRVLGLAEVMNYPAVRDCEETMINKLLETSKAGKKIDGHAAGLTASSLNFYMSAGIRTDHECTTVEEAKARLQKGMYVMIREGTVAKNLRSLIGVVTERNSRRCLFVTDDKHLDDLIEEGSIDYNVHLAIQEGIEPITAIQMATINTAECFGLSDKGAIAPGYKADFLMIEDLDCLTITQVFKDGQTVMDNGALKGFAETSLEAPEELRQTVFFHDLNTEKLSIPLKQTKANMIEIIPNSLLTKHTVEDVDINEAGFFQPSIVKDQLKLAVIERHKLTKLVGVGIVKGLGLKAGAIATTVAHDSHNLIVCGTNDSDILFAAQEIKNMQGGLVVVKDGEILASLKLPIAGLISLGTYEEVYRELQELKQALKRLGVSDHFNPFLTLSFLALPVIPELKLTVNGLFSVGRFKHIETEVDS
ncbi:adenine deaminase [Niallia oryzisoli]|uniref:Adenine deaminase n=1 Tax=Niallia oryzisoli TaxID=1737571 RepID=A0ABZ2CDJ2_9BACI